MTEALVGRTRSGLLELTQEGIAKALGGLAADKAHAAVLARDAVQNLLKQWK
jgi:hypothetical protein